MKQQKGQAIVEFAFIVPFFFLMCFGMIYGGILFMDYLQFNNAARGVARAIALTPPDARQAIADDFESKNSPYITQLTHLYDATPKVVPTGDALKTTQSVKIIIELTLNEEGVPKKIIENFLPKNLKPIEVVMPIETQKNS